MRCEQLSTPLLLLVYDELPPAERADVEKHLAHCAACQQRVAELRGTQRLLDQAPSRATQVDLAKVCLRLAARERRAIAGRRWAWGGAALAASVALFMAVQLLDVDLQPGRLTIAWQPAAAAPRPPDGQPNEGATIDVDSVRSESRANVLADVADRWLDSDDSSLAAAYARRGADRGPEAASFRQQDLSASAGDRSSEPRTRTYGDWRRELLGTDELLPQLNTLPGA